MGKGPGFLIGLIIVMPFLIQGQEAAMSFHKADSLTYSQYKSGDWKGLVSSGKEALKAGYDYYYLRTRLGVAYYERQNYLMAVHHFKAALGFNSADPFAGEYLYGCYLELNRPAEARAVYEKLPPSLKTKLAGTLPKYHNAHLDAGMLFSDQPEKFEQFDLDGADNYYGETDMTTGGKNLSAGLDWGFRNGMSIYGGYTWIRMDKNKMAKTGDTLAVDDQYPLDQHQFYLSGDIPLGKGFSVTPVVNYILDYYDVIMPQYDKESNNYTYPVEANKLSSFIGYLAVTRDFQVVQTSFFGAWSNLNERKQIQAGFHLVAFPFGNLDYYLSSKLLDHMIDGDHHFIFEQMFGMKVYKTVWAEVIATFGEMRDYHENNAYVLYNFAHDLHFKGGGKVMYTINSRATIIAEYTFLLREGNYIVYEDTGTPEVPEIVPVTIQEDFNNHIVVLGINWKF
jgi:tetratricopeptide (TPR) repeat protein